MTKKHILLFSLILLTLGFRAQNTALKAGDHAPPLVLLNQQGVLMSLNFPYLNKVVLVHFWSSTVPKSKYMIPRGLDLQERYSSMMFRNADGFEFITVAVQSDKTAWNQDIADMKMEKSINGIAPKGYNDMYIKGYKVSQLPVPLLIDETGTIVMVNPTMMQIEDFLDHKKNSPINVKDYKGKLLFTENPNDIVKNHKLFLCNKFNDTLSRTVTDAMGFFTFYGVKFMNEYIFRIDTAGEMQTKTSASLALPSGAVLGNLSRAPGKFDYKLGVIEINKLAGAKETTSNKTAISFNANISFRQGSAELETSSYTELDKMANLMTKNKDYTLEIISHTDSRGDDADNLELSKKRSSAVKAYLVSKNIAATRMKSIGKGEMEIKNKCKNKIPCSDEEHAENNRTEFKFFK
jgi:outer membrane protein OmpA-like peptidoglycan-associated protein